VLLAFVVLVVSSVLCQKIGWKEQKVMAAYRRVDDLVTCVLTACTPGSTPRPTLGNKCRKPFYFCFFTRM